MINKRKIYLAIPFSRIEEISFRCANEISSLLINDNYHVFSPISHSYPIWKTEMVPHTHEVWMDQDRCFVEWCDEIFLVNILGLEKEYGNDGMYFINTSKGVQMELRWTKELNKKVTIINYNPKTKTLNYEL